MMMETETEAQHLWADECEIDGNYRQLGRERKDSHLQFLEQHSPTHLDFRTSFRIVRQYILVFEATCLWHLVPPALK